jgi:hypothetical protein
VSLLPGLIGASLARPSARSNRPREPFPVEPGIVRSGTGTFLLPVQSPGLTIQLVPRLLTLYAAAPSLPRPSSWVVRT